MGRMTDGLHEAGKQKDCHTVKQTRLCLENMDYFLTNTGDWMEGGPFSSTSTRNPSMLKEKWEYKSYKYLTTHLRKKNFGAIYFTE
jgi:hypothetical protein